MLIYLLPKDLSIILVSYEHSCHWILNRDKQLTQNRVSHIDKRKLATVYIFIVP
jgi:hypothetical protein